MRFLKYCSVLMICSLLVSCEKQTLEDSDEVERKFVPTEVLVKTKAGFPIRDVFSFINSFHHDVGYIYGGVYTSNLPSEKLQYVLDYLNDKPYTNDGKAWFVTGYLHYNTQKVTIFPRFYNIKNKRYQEDWLQSMTTIQLVENNKGDDGYIIFFRVPRGQEKSWVRKFEKYNFVAWAELNYYGDNINSWP